MSKDYKHVPRQKNSPKEGPLAAILTFLTGLTLGLLVAVFIYLNLSDDSYTPFDFSFIKDRVSTVKEEPVVKEQVAAPEKPAIPAPKFDFYSILPNKEINISEWVADDPAAPVVAADQKDESVYILQVGSFRQLEAADEVKAQLALLGISADIQRVVINGQDTRYRVRVGPYAEQGKLDEERRRLQENNLEFMLLKLQADDPRASDG